MFVTYIIIRMMLVILAIGTLWFKAIRVLDLLRLEIGVRCIVQVHWHASIGIGTCTC